jgi:hypothetical protein
MASRLDRLTEAEVKDRLRQGKINSDTLVWKEGFADWMQLSTVPELTAILARITRQPARQGRGTRACGAGTCPSSNAMRAVAEPAQSSSPILLRRRRLSRRREQRICLHQRPHRRRCRHRSLQRLPRRSCSAACRRSRPKPWPPSRPGNGAGSTQLTGQRNENSVLFSLSNLEALACQTVQPGFVRPRAAPPPRALGSSTFAPWRP